MLKCSFCGKPYESEQLLEGVEGSVCASCLTIIKEIKNPFESGEVTELKLTPSSETTDIPKPSEIKSFLNRYIIGQDEAKSLLSTEAYLHLKYAESPELDRKKNNICLIGPSGCGKTYLVEKLSEFLNVPFIIEDATKLTKSGYTGGTISDMFERLYKKSGEDLGLAQKGIIFIDEIDKISSRYNISSGGSDVGTVAVQQELLKALEGGIYEIGGSHGLNGSKAKIFDTKNVLFILSGAFVGLNGEKKESIGFNSNKTIEPIKSKDVSTDDLIKFGFIPEFVGRISLLLTLEALNTKQIKEILLVSEGSVITSYKNLFEAEGIQLSFNDQYINSLAESVNKGKVGVRGLNNSLSKTLNSILYEKLEKGDFSEVSITENIFCQA